MNHCAILCTALTLLLLSVFSPAQADSATRQLSHDIFRGLIEINTTDSVGEVKAITSQP